jgi:hypothetical protein
MLTYADVYTDDAKERLRINNGKLYQSELDSEIERAKVMCTHHIYISMYAYRCMHINVDIYISMYTSRYLHIVVHILQVRVYVVCA